MQARSVGYSHQVALESQKLTVVLVPQEDVYVNFEKILKYLPSALRGTAHLSFQHVVSGGRRISAFGHTYFKSTVMETPGISLPVGS